MDKTNNISEIRNHDEECERLCGEFIDRFLWKKVTEKNHGIRHERVTDKIRQVRGEDVVIYKDEKPFLVIDEKAKVQGLINQILSYPSFEVISRDRTSKHNYFVSWFANPRQTTNIYGFVALGTGKEVQYRQEHTLTEADLTCAVYTLFRSKPLHDFILKATGRTMDEIAEDAFEIAENPSRNYGEKVFCRDLKGNTIKLKISNDRPEKPVNLVIRKDILKNVYTEYTITKDGFCKREPNFHFERNPNFHTWHLENEKITD